MTAATEQFVWWHAAACKDIDPDLFHPSEGQSTAAARAVCATCPVRPECLDWALRNGERFGVWGGTSERERRRMRRPGPVVQPQTTKFCVCCSDVYLPSGRAQLFCSAECRKFHTTRCLNGGHVQPAELLWVLFLLLFIVLGLRLLQVAL